MNGTTGINSIVYLSLVSSWQPPADDLTAEPSLSYTDPLFRRRISQLSRMTVEVVHSLFEKAPQLGRNTKLVFSSFRGEIDQEFKINEQLIEESMIKPASFSLSVFNTSVALATIQEHLTGGYSAVYPSEGHFCDALLSACAPVICGKEDKIIFVYGDEYIRDEYRTLDAFKACGSPVPDSSLACIASSPLAFAVLISKEPFDGNSVAYDTAGSSSVSLTPHEFLKSAASMAGDKC